MYKLLASIAALVVAASVQAAPVTYTDFASFQAAAGSTTGYAFPVLPSDEVMVAPSYMTGGVTFAGPDLAIYNDGFFGAGQSYLGAHGITLSLGSGKNAISLDLGAFTSADTIDISINGSMVGSFATGGAPATTFVGFVDNDPILTLALSVQSGNEVDILDFSTADANPVPEPAMLGLFGMGAVALSVARRRRTV